MLVKLLALLKKDAILATRSKVWTLFELLLPIFILFCVNGMMTEVAKTMKDAGKEMKSASEILSRYSTESGVFFKSPQICDGKQVTTLIFFRNGNDELYKEYDMNAASLRNITKKKFTLDDMKKEMTECEKATMIVHKTGKDITVYVPAGTSEIPTKEVKSAMERNGDAYLFGSIFIQAIIEDYTPDPKGNKGWSEKVEVKKIDTRDIDIPEVALPFFHAIIGLSMVVTVVNVVRTIVTEKSTVKPYLSAIGLPGWLFYTEHFISSFLKSIITCIGSMKFFMGLKYVNTGIMMFSTVFYIIGAIAFAVLMASFFTNAKRGIEASLVFWIVAVFYPLSQEDDSLSLLWSLNINYAFNFFLKKAQENSLANNQLTFGSLFDMTYINGTAPGYFLLMIFVDVVWMIAAALLYDRYGGKLSGIKDMFTGGGKGRAKAGGSDDDVILQGCIENVKMRSKAVSDVELKNVVKIYPTGEKAVNGLSFRAIRGQVSILLGQNGCGKSTTFSMISGVALPTSGSIKVAGVDAVRHKDKARKFIGFCPQYNPLYDRLTVLEHLELVNALKEGPSHLVSWEEAKTINFQRIRLG
ncbi:hypothetical protein CAEBREN_30211 [Caenorhabditis brenneri]|uniref:Uncharacterized protein n=1 Tax=Caenorhabditis brenneri TaxID=135651 RepID=G0MK05_CAEBE|nr:hypothetical protein CAEBREN_30211 [Caenorhabditis brenneri]